jgi:hypothetical protein
MVLGGGVLDAGAAGVATTACTVLTAPLTTEVAELTAEVVPAAPVDPARPWTA